MASSSTLYRFERRAERQWVIAIHQELVEQFIASFSRHPEELVLDFDTTDVLVHGHQPKRFFHGYHDGYCDLPLCVLCGQHGLSSSFGPGCGEACVGDIVLVGQEVARGMAWGSHRVSRGLGVLPASDCERHAVGYVVGLARHRSLERGTAVACEIARSGFEATGRKSRWFTEFQYAAGIRRRSRRVIARIEHGGRDAIRA